MVGNQHIGSVDRLPCGDQGVKPGSTVLLLVRRDDVTRFIGLTVPKD